MWLTLSLALISSQFREVPLTQFSRTADARFVTAVATSQDGHVVSLWTRWSETAPTCQGWTLDDEGARVEALGDVPCPPPAPRGKRHLFLDTRALGAPKTLVPVLDSAREQVALVFPRALGVARDEDGALVGAWSTGDFTLRGVAPAEKEWLVWVQDAKGADRLFFVDPQWLTTGPLEEPLVESVPRVTLSGFGWKKDMPSRQVGPCTLEGRGVMVDEQVLLLDWRASTSRLEVRAVSTTGEQRVWKVDAAGGTPVAGLDVQRVRFARHGVWRLSIRFPFVPTQLSVSELDKPAKRLSPVLRPAAHGGSASCVSRDGVLQPADFTLDPRWR
jgi:hypothetical protein